MATIAAAYYLSGLREKEKTCPLLVTTLLTVIVLQGEVGWQLLQTVRFCKTFVVFFPAFE